MRSTYLYYLLTIILTLGFAGQLYAANGAPDPQFIKNKGQWDSHIQYSLEFNPGFLFIENGRVTYVLYSNEIDSFNHVHNVAKPKHGAVFRVNYTGCLPDAEIQGNDILPYYHNYYLGRDHSKWASDVPVYAQTRYKNLYNGIDLVYKGVGDQLEYSFEISPGADPSVIKMSYDGVNGLSVVDGDLRYSTSVSTVQETKLNAWQSVNGKQENVPCNFVVNGSEVSFSFPSGYDKTQPLTIDPLLVFSTFTGSKQDNFGFTATYDADSNGYIGGIGVNESRYGYFNYDTYGYPITAGAFQPNYGGGDCDATISKMNQHGTAFIFSTYLGGSGSETPNSMIVNHANELLIYGETSSPDFPVTSGAFDTTFHGGVSDSLPDNGAYFYGGTDIYITKLDSNGHLLASTLFGGPGNDGLNYTSLTTYSALAYNYSDAFRGEIQVDSLDNVYVASCTSSPTLYPSAGSAIRDALSGNQDGLIFTLTPDLSALRWQAYIGGSNVDALYSLDIGADGNVYATGGTMSADFPTSPGALIPNEPGDRDGFVVKLKGDGSAILASTYIGTPAYDQSFFVRLGPDSNVYITGQTLGQYPVTPGTYNNLPNSTQFIHCLKPTLDSTIFSTVFGTGTDSVNISPTAFMVDECGFIYVCGWGGLVNHNYYNPYTGHTTGLFVTDTTFVPVTHGSNFYLLVLAYHADSIKFATFAGSRTVNNEDHVDGGTSRFDPRAGTIYEAVCASCAHSGFYTTPGVIATGDSSFNCNEALFKFDPQIAHVSVQVQANPSANGCVPFTVNFNSVAVNASNYLWNFGDGDTSTQADPSHIYTDTGTFRVSLVGLNPGICPLRLQLDTSYLTVLVRENSLVAAQFTNTVINNCDSFVLQLNNSSTNAAQYQWNFGDGDSTNTVSPIHRYIAPGNYTIRLIASNVITCNQFDTTYTTVSFKPKLILSAATNDTTGCKPLILQFNSQATGSGHTAFSWNFGDGTPLSNLQNPPHTYDSAGIYMAVLTVTDTGTCNQVVIDTITINVLNDSLQAAFNLSVLKNVCDTLQVSLNNQSQYATSIEWYFGNGDSSSLSSLNYTYNQAGSYVIKLVASNPGDCRLHDTLTQTVTLKPVLSASITIPDTSGCAPLTVSFNSHVSGTAALVYIWSFGDGIIDLTNNDPQPVHTYDSVGNYKVVLIATDTGTCNVNVSDTITVSTHTDTLHAGFSLNVLRNICDTLDVQLTDQSVGAASVLWTFGDGTTSTQASPSHSYHTADTFNIVQTVTGRYCRATDTAAKQVVLLPKVLASFTPKNGCVPYSYQPVNTSSNATSYLWQFKNDSTSTETAPTITYTTAGSFRLFLTAYNPNTCNDSNSYSAVFTIFPSPIAMFTTDSNTYQLFTPVTFINQSTRPASYSWVFGDGQISTDSAPVHVFVLDGTIQPCLTVTDTNQCTAEYCKTLDISFVGVVDVPNAFSPNGDGVNDVLYVKGYGVQDLEFRIYNRWGQLVFESHSLADGWDGTFKGSRQEMDVYTYTLEATFKNGVQTALKKGNITLLR